MLAVFRLMKGRTMSKFNFVEDTMKKFNARQPIDFNTRFHDDLVLIREEALVSKEDFLVYIEANRKDILKVLDVKCLYEDEISLVWRDLFDADGVRYRTTTYETFKDGKLWRSMMNKEIVGNDVLTLD